MYDRERLGKIFSDLERFLTDLEGIGIRSVKELEDARNFYSVSMLVFSIINRALDLGEEIISARNLGTPGTYKDIFFLLYKGKVINSRMKDELSELSYYRNLFSHEYQDFTEKDVFYALGKVSVVRDFIKKAKASLK